MPSYHFNVFDGYSSSDTEGTELPDWPTARHEAVRLAGLILAEEGGKLLTCQEWRLEVTDATGLILLRLDVSMAESSAIGGGVTEAVPARSPSPRSRLL